jgi:hypothetical protein
MKLRAISIGILIAIFCLSVQGVYAQKYTHQNLTSMAGIFSFPEDLLIINSPSDLNDYLEIYKPTTNQSKKDQRTFERLKGFSNAFFFTPRIYDTNLDISVTSMSVSRMADYIKTIELAKQNNALVILKSPEIEVQIPLISLEPGNVNVFQPKEADWEADWIEIETRTTSTLIGITCLGCTNTDIKDLINHYNVILGKAAVDGGKVEINLTNDVRDIFSSKFTGSIEKPVDITVKQTETECIVTSKTQTVSIKFEGDDTYPDAYPADTRALQCENISETLNRTIEKAKENKVYVLFRKQESKVAPQLTLSLTDKKLK